MRDYEIHSFAFYIVRSLYLRSLVESGTIQDYVGRFWHFNEGQPNAKSLSEESHKIGINVNKQFE